MIGGYSFLLLTQIKVLTKMNELYNSELRYLNYGFEKQTQTWKYLDIKGLSNGKLSVDEW